LPKELPSQVRNEESEGKFLDALLELASNPQWKDQPHTKRLRVVLTRTDLAQIHQETGDFDGALKLLEAAQKELEGGDLRYDQHLVEGVLRKIRNLLRIREDAVGKAASEQ